jgi:hypothetical protein
MILIGALVILIVLGVVALIALRKRRTERLKTKFGNSEYDRALAKGGNRGVAEANLESRAERVEGFHVRPLAPEDRARFSGAWQKVQLRFVDGPAGAVSEADQLVGDVMSTRGYPVTNFEQRAADISVGHPLVLENYRTAHDIAVRQSQGQASTEELRQAMVHYRTLFEDLLSERETPLTKQAVTGSSL